MAAETITPMMQQYHAVRRDLPPGTLLMFRREFYEMFGEDAHMVVLVLNVALTKRGTTPMCGVPFHAARGYIEKLIAAGWRVAICDQVGEATAGNSSAARSRKFSVRERWTISGSMTVSRITWPP